MGPIKFLAICRLVWRFLCSHKGIIVKSCRIHFIVVFCIGSKTARQANFWDGGWIGETCQRVLWQELACFCFPWLPSPRYSWTPISSSLYSWNRWGKTGSWYFIFFFIFFFPLLISCNIFPAFAENACIAAEWFMDFLLSFAIFYNLQPCNG